MKKLDLEMFSWNGTCLYVGGLLNLMMRLGLTFYFLFSIVL